MCSLLLCLLLAAVPKLQKQASELPMCIRLWLNLSVPLAHFAAAHGAFRVLRTLLFMGESLDSPDTSGWHPLQHGNATLIHMSSHVLLLLQ